MLALARGEGQSIIIDGNIEVKIVKWSRSSVRIAIQAPREITVDRDEIWRKMHPGEMTPLEKAERERQERFAREGGSAPHQAGAAPGRPAEAVHVVRAPAAGKVRLNVAMGATVDRETIVATLEDASGTAGGSAQQVKADFAGTVSRLQVGEGQHVQAGEAIVSIREA